MRPIIQYDLEGNIIKTYHSIADAAFETDTHANLISSCCQGKIHTAGGFQWRYYDQPSDLINIGLAKSHKQVAQYTRKGELVKVYRNIVQAARDTHIDGSNIGRCCHNKARTAGNYIWKFFNEDEVA